MGLPWLAALKAAETILAGTAARRAATAASKQFENVSDRLTILETNDEEQAKVLVQLAEQIQTMSAAAEAQAARLRWLLILSSAAAAIAAIALVVVLTR